MKAILLDTNVYSRYMLGDLRLTDVIAKANTVYLSVVVLGELYAGFHGGARAEQNHSQLRSFLALDFVKIIEVSHQTAQLFGVIKNELKRKGKMLPLNDIWIAAHAQEVSAQLMTYDVHFQHIQHLNLWTEAFA